MQKKINWKRIIWTLSILVLCYSDQQIGSVPGEPQLVFHNVAVIAVGVIALTHYPLRSYLKWPYLIGAVISAIAGYFAVQWGNSHSYYPKRFQSIVILTIVFGFLLLRTAQAYIFEKKRFSVNRIVLLVYGIFLLLACLSRYDTYWDKIYLGCYGLIFLTAFTEKELKTLANALADGIIIGFILLQGLAFIHRPYDMLRYLGMYANTNMNSLLYQVSYCAFLARFCLLEADKEESGKWQKLKTVWKWCCFVLACSMWGFVLLTMCRSAMMAMGAVTLAAFIWLLYRNNIHRVRNGIRYIALLALCSAVCFPLAYASARFLPAVFDDPWYFYEGMSDSRVTADDPWDSPKFTKWEDVLRENFGRMADLFELFSRSQQEEERTPWLLCSSGVPRLTAAASGGNKSTSIRMVIYSHYFHSLNLWGHLAAENGVQVTENYFAPHAHDVFLQYAFNYGILAGIFFLCHVILVIIFLWRAAAGSRQDRIIPLFLFLSVLVFGLTETMWQNGMLSNTLMLFLPVLASERKGSGRKRR